MATSGELAANFDYRAVLDHLGAGLLIFNEHDKLILDNVAARRILGANLVLIRSEGWSAIAMLIDANPGGHATANEMRARSMRQASAVRFSILLAGSYMPCWLATFTDQEGHTFTQVVIDSPDWTALTELMSTFRAEARSAINDTKGQAIFVQKLLQNPPSGISTADLGKKAMGMITLISTQMHRLQLLIDLLHRLEIIRTGQLAAQIEKNRKRISLEDFIEDFIEELNEEPLLDPTINVEEYRSRLKLDIDDDLHVVASKPLLRAILRDLLRNAFMYSEAGTPVTLRISSASQGRHVQFDTIDQGCGVRAKETERVFEPFQRGRQPQVMREHGYGLSLYLVKAEVEAMDGRIWFTSEEGVGSTFSFKLPAHSP